MTLENVLVYIVVGVIAGFLAGLVVMGRGRGLFWNLIIGILGAIIGGWLANELHLNINLGADLLNRIVIAFVGAVILLLIWRLIFRRGKK
jgi:uncharacterized membrane protein YeaQ/YmgE (transglycosylase-associated protein family)